MFGILLGSTIILLVFGWFKFCLSYWKRRGISGPDPWPIIGNIGQHLLGKQTLGAVIYQFYKNYGEYPFMGLFRGTKPVLLIRDPEFVNQVLIKDFKSFRNNEFVLDPEDNPLFGLNPFILKDEIWKDTRQMLTPGMTSGKMKSMYPLLKEICEKFVKYTENFPNRETDGIETRSLTKRLTLDNVAKTAFGIDGKSFSKYDDISEFNKLVNHFMNPGSAFAIVFTLMQIFPAVAKIFKFGFISGNVENQLLTIVSEVVDYRRKNNIKANDYLQFLIDLAEKRNLPDRDITSHACTFFIDGYETSSLALSYVLFNLAQHPEYQEKIREETKRYEQENGGELTYEALHEMRWLNACLYESLRRTPPIDFLMKLCNETFEYTSRDPRFKRQTVKLTPGDLVLLPYGYTCRDPKYFPDPDKFLPERMFEKDLFIKGSFIPFSDGPRSCIGRRFGIMQVKLAVAYILKHFELSVSPKMKQPIRYIPFHFLNEIKGGMWIRYKMISN